MRKVGLALFAPVAFALAACGAQRPAAPVMAPAPQARARVTAIPMFEPAVARADVAPRPTAPARPRHVRNRTLPDGAVLRALRANEPGLHHCFASALRADPGLGRIKVPIHLHIGARGRVLHARASAGIARLDACVTRVVRRLRFPAPGAPMDVDLPLFFAGS